ncbi:hypothetical protein [Rhodococcus sp. SGAir0479]|uniref:hypothetical protein n=1 Tax=Rhodococcus sp. SGAir0479 TaxID=2567884 RepID=UPI0010CCF3C3|nr:hypothetical protein [Rhodococcus sp. SGAir0479]QCQ91732.1 hypothetical protein E7742_11145 [Rhodococcus sp. SGAir0479]
MRIVMPFAPAAVRDFLVNTPEFTDVVPAHLISTRDTPEQITRPFVLVRPSANTGTDPMLRRPWVQIDACVPPIEVMAATDDPAIIDAFCHTDPEETAWNIAALAGELIGRARPVQWRNGTWRGEWRDGPLALTDKSRANDMPLYRSPVRVELKMSVS